MATRKPRGGLGKGLDALLGEKKDPVIVVTPENDDSISELDVNKIQAGVYQPRTQMD